MSREVQGRVTGAYSLMLDADRLLKKAAKYLAEFGEDVPSVNTEALQMMAETTNTLSTSIDFIRSFVRVSLLQQVVPKEAKGLETKKEAP